MRRGQCSLQIFPRTGTRIDQSAVAQFAPCVEIKTAAFALRIRPKVAEFTSCRDDASVAAHSSFANTTSKIKVFIPIQPQPVQVFIHGADELRLASLIVEVFIAEDEFAMCGACALPRHPEGARVSQMEIAGGRRRKPPAIRRAFSH